MAWKCSGIPFNHNINGWPLEEGQRPPEHKPLAEDIETDWVVIGSGFSGVAFAGRLAALDNKLRIVLLDAASATESSSARNSGFMIGLPHNIGSSTAELKKANDYRTLLQEGARLLNESTETHGIDCEWENVGKYHCMVDRSGDGILKEYIASLEVIGEPYEVLENEALHARLGTRFYSKGIHTPSCVLVNPAKLIDGLVRNLPVNVRVFDHTPVLSIDQSNGIVVTTPLATIRSRHVMLATNALSAGLYPTRSRQAAMATYASLTEPLTPVQRERLPAELSSWGLTPVNAIAGATLRFTRDQRFLVRQHVEAALDGQISPQRTWNAAQKHKAFFKKVFPQLADVKLAHTWSGTISVTRNGAPVWGKLHPGIYTAGGCNGAGISKQTVAGHLLADYAVGHDNPLIATMQSLGQANFMPPSPFLDIGIAASLWKERFLGRKEI